MIIMSRGGVLLALGLEGMGTRVPPPALMIDLHFTMKQQESVYCLHSIFIYGNNHASYRISSLEGMS